MKLGGGRTRDPGANEGCGAYDQDMLYMCVKFSTNKKGIVKIDPSIFPAMASSHFPVFNGFLGVMIIWLIQQLQEPTQINKIYTKISWNQASYQIKEWTPHKSHSTDSGKEICIGQCDWL